MTMMTRVGFNLAAGAAALTLAVVVAGVGSSKSAEASTTQACLPQHCYADAIHGADASVSAFNLETHANFMTPGCSGPSDPWHMTAEQWVIMNDGSYVEMGIINAWTYWPDNKVSQPTNAYAFFWSDTDADGHQSIHTIRNTVPDGTDHTFSIQRTAPKTWAFILDGQIAGVSGIVHASAAVQQRIGLEWAAPDAHTCGARADRFDMYPSLYYGGGSGWTDWHTYTPNPAASTMHLEGHLANRPTYLSVWKDA
jgi:hypothetical protein